MNSYLTQYEPDKQFSTAERCTINELLNHAADSQCSIARASVAPGVCTQLHALKNTIERYIILTGQGRVFINNEAPEEVLPLDSVTIPADVAQKIENTGETELVFLCICTPRFIPQNYYTLKEQ